jgi:hypothetical protein
MLLEWEKLFQPYTKDGCTLELFRNWLITQGFDDTIVDAVLTDLFVELKSGRSFLKPCDCGCSNTNIHTYINHYAYRKCQEAQQKIAKVKSRLLEYNLNKKILNHIHKQNEKYLKSEFPRGVPPQKEIVEEKWKRTLLEREEDVTAREIAVMIKERNLTKERAEFHRQITEIKEKMKKSLL